MKGSKSKEEQLKEIAEKMNNSLPKQFDE